MKRVLINISAALIVLPFALVGCDSAQENAANPAAEATEESATNGQTDMEKMKAELAKLPPEDAAAAEKQHYCPVTGEMLGTMGAPQKVEVEGQEVWICCEHCKDALMENPDKYLSKLSQE